MPGRPRQRAAEALRDGRGGAPARPTRARTRRCASAREPRRTGSSPTCATSWPRTRRTLERETVTAAGHRRGARPGRGASPSGCRRSSRRRRPGAGRCEPADLAARRSGPQPVRAAGRAGSRRSTATAGGRRSRPAACASRSSSTTWCRPSVPAAERRPRAAAARRTSRRCRSVRARSVASSLDLRGARVEEALEALDRYLDDAVARRAGAGHDHPRPRHRRAARCRARRRPATTRWSSRSARASAAKAGTARRSSGSEPTGAGVTRVGQGFGVLVGFGRRRRCRRRRRRRRRRRPGSGVGVGAGDRRRRRDVIGRIRDPAAWTPHGGGASGQISVGANGAPQDRPNGANAIGVEVRSSGCPSRSRA